MSTILKALRRLEEEKVARAAERPLREEVLARQTATGRRRFGARAALLLGAATLVCGLALAFVSSRDASAPSVAQAPPPPSGEAGQPDAARAGAAKTSAQAAAVGQDVADLSPPAAAPSAPPAQASLPVEGQPLVAVIDRPAPSPALAEVEPPVEPPAPPPSRADVLAARNPSAQERPDLREPTSPTATTLAPRDTAVRPKQRPQPARRREPELVVTRTVWHPRSERRLALVLLPGDGAARELREGDDVGELVVKRIDPSGVVFDGDGGEIVRRVGQP